MAVAANEGTRLRASYVDDGSRAKGRVNMTAAQPQKTDLNEGIFCQASNSAVASTFVERFMQWCLQWHKSNAREVMSLLDDMEHHLREMIKRKLCV
jgi:hypothetical protein